MLKRILRRQPMPAALSPTPALVAEARELGAHDGQHFGSEQASSVDALEGKWRHEVNPAAERSLDRLDRAKSEAAHAQLLHDDAQRTLAHHQARAGRPTPREASRWLIALLTGLLVVCDLGLADEAFSLIGAGPAVGLGLGIAIAATMATLAHSAGEALADPTLRRKGWFRMLGLVSLAVLLSVVRGLVLAEHVGPVGAVLGGLLLTLLPLAVAGLVAVKSDRVYGFANAYGAWLKRSRQLQKAELALTQAERRHESLLELAAAGKSQLTAIYGRAVRDAAFAQPHPRRRWPAAV